MYAMGTPVPSHHHQGSDGTTEKKKKKDEKDREKHEKEKEKVRWRISYFLQQSNRISRFIYANVAAFCASHYSNMFGFNCLF